MKSKKYIKINKPSWLTISTLFKPFLTKAPKQTKRFRTKVLILELNFVSTYNNCVCASHYAASGLKLDSFNTYLVLVLMSVSVQCCDKEKCDLEKCLATNQTNVKLKKLGKSF